MGDFACGSGLPVKMHRLWTSDYDRTKACRKKYKRNSKKSLKSHVIRAIVDARDILLLLAHSLKEWARDQKEENSHE